MKTLIALLLLAAAQAHAHFIELGEITLTGNFTVNHAYNFNDPNAAPFGWFGPLTAQSATGVFSPYVMPGDPLAMSTVELTINQSFVWTLSGYTLSTTFTNVAAAGFWVGSLDISGNGFNPPEGTGSGWSFWSPAWPPDIDADFTGPISLSIGSGYDNGIVPDGGSTFGLLGLALFGLGAVRRLGRP